MLKNFLRLGAVQPAFQVSALYYTPTFFFRSKNQVQPKLKMRTVTPIYPPPGMNLEIPGNNSRKSVIFDRVDPRKVLD